jgi:hypothetical protein
MLIGVLACSAPPWWAWSRQDGAWGIGAAAAHRRAFPAGMVRLHNVRAGQDFAGYS